MTDESKSLRTKRAQLVQEMHDLTKNSGEWNARGDKAKSEAEIRWDAKNIEQEQLKNQIDAIERSAGLQAEMGNVSKPPMPSVQTGIDTNTRETAELSDTEKRVTEILGSSEYRSEWNRWVRTGNPTQKFNSMAAEVRTYAALNTGSGAAGDFTVPIGFQRELEIVMKAFGGMRRNSRVVPTSTGNPLHWPAVDDTANQGRVVAENGAVSQTNPTFAEVIYNSYLYSSDQVLVSVQLLQDSAFNMEALLAELLGIRLGRNTEADYTTGAGSTTATGIITSILADSVPLTVTAAGSNANDGVSGNNGTNSIGTDDLADLIAKVDPAYRPGAKFMAHQSVLDYLKKVKDKYGRPLFVDGTNVGQPDKIFGYPYDWNQGMDATVGGVPAAAKNSVLFGDFSKYIIRDVAGITMVRYNELYMPNHQIGFQAFLRTDGKRLQQKAFALLVQHS
jgi:HK97 family phage major capsid protein